MILDTETTGHADDAEIVEIAGNVLLDGLVRPVRSIPSEAIQIHGINAEMLASALTWSQLHEQYESIVARKKRRVQR